MSQHIHLETIDPRVLVAISGGEFVGKFFPRAFDSSGGLDLMSGRLQYCETNAQDGGSRCELREKPNQQQLRNLGYTPEWLQRSGLQWPVSSR